MTLAAQKLPPPAVREGSGAMFDALARRYDLLNRLMSLGLDSRWRRQLVAALDLRGPARVLDVATGTADVAISICKQYPDMDVAGLDPSAAMLAQGATKVQNSGLSARVQLVRGDAQALPFAMHTFGAACISFGIRNVPDRLQGLREMVRVCKPGARVAVLELGEPRDGILGPLVRFHVHQVVPFLGGLLSGAREYRYLQQSIAAFPAPPDFMALMMEAGLVGVEHKRLNFGAVHLYWGRVPGR